MNNASILEESRKAPIVDEASYTKTKCLNEIEGEQVCKQEVEYKIRESEDYYNIEVSLALSKKDNEYIFSRLKNKDDEWIRRLINYKIFGAIDDLYDETIFDIVENSGTDLEEFLGSVM
jgi:hypothetical protein